MKQNIKDEMKVTHSQILMVLSPLPLASLPSGVMQKARTHLVWPERVTRHCPDTELSTHTYIYKNNRKLDLNKRLYDLTSRKAECDRVACSECAPLSTLNQRYSLPDLDGLIIATTRKLALWGDAEGTNIVSVTFEGDETLSRYRAINTSMH